MTADTPARHTPALAPRFSRLPQLALACALALAISSRAAEPALTLGSDVTELSLEDLMHVPVPTVTTASKFAQKATDAPASVTVITRDDIQRYGYRTLAEILASARGFYTTYDGAYSYAGVRGFNRPGDYGSRLLLLIDGHRANENMYSSALLGTEGILDVDLIDRVEIIRGPASSLYGSSAFFGVINVITRQPGTFHAGEASASVGSLETYTGRLTFAHRFTSGLEILLSGSAIESSGHRRY